MKKPLLLLFLLVSGLAQAQRLQGKVIDQVGQPLAYVNVGVVGKDVGTVTTERGTFSLLLPDSLNAETVLISAIGYAPLRMQVGDLKQRFLHQSAVIQLQEQAVALQEVVVRPKKYKTKIVGNQTNSKSILAGFKSNGLGSEVGTVLKINKPSYLEEITFNIGGNKYNTLFLRINVYRFGKNGPAENLLREPLYVRLAKEGLGDGIVLDVKDRHIYLDTDVLLSLELVKDLGEGGLWFSGGLINNDSYYRKVSQGAWQKIPVIGLGFHATITQEQ